MKYSDQERTSRYLEILKENDEGCTTLAFRELDKLSDEDLSNPTKVAETVAVIHKYMQVIHATGNKYPAYIMCYIRMNLGLHMYDDSKDEKINNMDPDKAFHHVLAFNGLGRYESAIKSWITDIYGRGL